MRGKDSPAEQALNLMKTFNKGPLKGNWDIMKTSPKVGLTEDTQ
jgi:hypothetical protein